MKKFFSLVLALVMALSLTTVAWGADTDAAGLKAALLAGGEVNLTEDATISEEITITQNTTLTADAGKTITLNADGMLIAASGATLTLGEGVVINAAETAVNAKGGAVIIAGAEITCSSGTFAAVAATNGGTVTVEADSSIAAANLSAELTAVIAKGAGSEVIINGGTLHSAKGSTAVAEDGGKVTVNNGTLTAPQSRALVSIGGPVIMNNGTVEGIWAHAYSTSSATVNNGTLTWKVDAKNGADVTINGGTFQQPVGADTTGATLTIKGGTFTTAPAAEYIADGYALDTATGVVSTKAAGGAADSTLYFWDNGEAKWLVGYVASGDDLDDLAQDSSDNCLPCYCVDGEYFVETTKAAATYKLVYGAKTVYLKAVPSTAVCYSAKASVLKVVDAEVAECGDWNVVALDEDDVYYAAYDKKTGAVTDVFVAEKNGSVQILVNGKIVDAEELTIGTDVEWMLHTWKGNNVVNKAYVDVKCSECGKVATLYANATAATVGKKDGVKVVVDGTTLGWITAADFFGFGTASVPSTDKVESAATFDAGIAMYVGMSVMAAAGSVVVLKKRED